MDNMTINLRNIGKNLNNFRSFSYAKDTGKIIVISVDVILIDENLEVRIFGLGLHRETSFMTLKAMRHEVLRCASIGCRRRSSF